MAPKSRDDDQASASKLVSEHKQTRTVDNLLTPVKGEEGERSHLPLRPNTSAGSDSTFRRRMNLGMGLNKDDSSSISRAIQGKGIAIDTSENLPTPSSSPIKSIGPLYPGKSSLKRPTQRPATPDSMEMVEDVEALPEPVIGMALGSPSHPPIIPQPISADINSRISEAESSIQERQTPMPHPEHKQSKWKTLGGLLGAKKSDATDVYQVGSHAASRSQLSATLPESSPVVETPRPKSRGRARAKSVKGQVSEDKLGMKRNDTAPIRFVLTGDWKQAPTPKVQLAGMESEGRSTPLLLDVEIPTTKLDRYSVMFSGVLQNAPQSRSSSLLARRQATLDRLKPVNEALASKEQHLDAPERHLMPRRASSPQLTKSPGFSLFPKEQTSSRPSSPSRHPQAPNLHRSNTAPAGLSPARPSFAPGLSNPVHAALLATPTARKDIWVDEKGIIRRGPPLSVITAQKSPSVTSPQPLTSNPQHVDSKTQLRTSSPHKTTDWSLETSHLSLDSPEIVEDTTDHGHLSRVDESEEEDIYDLKPRPSRSVLPEPRGETMQKSPAPPSSHTPKSSTSTSGSSYHSYSTSASSVTSPQSVTTRAVVAGKPPPVTGKRPLPQNPRPQRPRAATTSTIIPHLPVPTEQTASIAHRRKASLITTVSHGRSSATPSPGPKSPEEIEARLKSAADLSIARQISISQQQQQLLRPLKANTKSTATVSPQRETQAMVRGMTFPAPVGAIGVSSPLSVVASAARERATSPAAQRASPDRQQATKDMEQDKPSLGVVDEYGFKPGERLVQSIKPSTPTLVVVDEYGWESGYWNGHQAIPPAVGLAERRRRTRQQSMSEKAVGKETRTRSESEEREAREAMDRLLKARELQHRKSERVLIERVSTESAR